MAIPCVFLFNADETVADLCYGDYFDHYLFAQMVQMPELKSINTGVLFGDLLLSCVCKRIREVSQSPSDRGVSRTYCVDKELYVTLAYDLAESLGMQWATFDIEQLTQNICSNNIHCVTFTSVPAEVCRKIDSHLKTIPGYLGAAIIDSGNPLHNQLFGNLLIYSLFIRDGVFFPQIECRSASILKQLTPAVNVQPLSDIDFYLHSIPRPNTSNLSPRGEITKRILDARAAPLHKERVALSLTSQPGRELRFVVPEETKLEQVQVLKDKIVGYVLNHNHNEGKHKAKLFKDLLEIDTKDWRFLAAQIVEALPKADVQRVRVTDYGVQYHADIQVRGQNENSRTVRTCWIVVGTEPPRLTTAYICDLDEQREGEGELPGILPKDNLNIQDWYKLVLSLAVQKGQTAAIDAIPTPMFVGDGVQTAVVSGACGGAYVVIPDARKGFARWLRINNIGSANYKGGWCIYDKANDQTVDKAEAYARAVARVLCNNGIECEVKTYLT